MNPIAQAWHKLCAADDTNIAVRLNIVLAEFLGWPYKTASR
jgi:hypothetical protein